MIRLVILLLGVAGAASIILKKEPVCGVEASTNLIHQNPWVVYLDYWREDKRADVLCTATLIDSQHLITAAHCIKHAKFTRLVARLGEYDLTKEADCVAGVCSSPVVYLEVTEAVIHPDYNGKGHDIAVLRLKEKAPYTDFIRPICLPTGELQPEITFVASGWGQIPRLGYNSPIKKIIPLPYWERDACVATLKNFEVPPNVICAGGEEGIDTCKGDSGGPLVWVRERAELWGVTSIGNVNCGTKDSPAVYTNVADHLDWILTVVEVLNIRYFYGFPN